MFSRVNDILTGLAFLSFLLLPIDLIIITRCGLPFETLFSLTRDLRLFSLSKVSKLCKSLASERISLTRWVILVSTGPSSTSSATLDNQTCVLRMKLLGQ